MGSAWREPTGDVVLDSNGFAMRFSAAYGGAPLEIYSNGMMVSNPFPGSGTSAAFDTGQDPTQASANGLLRNPICTFFAPSSQKYNYYGREVLLSENEYHIASFLPDFWLSAEAPDDAIAPPLLGGSNGWRTKYAPGNLIGQLNAPDCPVIFEGSVARDYGFFFPADVWKTQNEWNNRLRSFGNGRIAFKVTISLFNAKSDISAGVIFRAQIPQQRCFREDILKAQKLWLTFTVDGLYSVKENNNVLRSGKLTAAQTRLLTSQAGLEIEVRTNNYQPEYFEILADGKSLLTATSTVTGPHFALYGRCTRGFIKFSNRQLFHVGAEALIKYKALDNGVIRSEIQVRVPAGLELPTFYKANLPGMFLNPNTFPLQNRCTQGLLLGEWIPVTALHRFTDFEAYWAGNIEGTHGLRVSNIRATVNGTPNPDAHLLIEASATDPDSFVLMLNPFTLNSESLAYECSVTADWSGVR